MIFILFFYNQSTILNIFKLIGKGKCLYFLIEDWKINFLKIKFIHFNSIIIINKKEIEKYKNHFIIFRVVYCIVKKFIKNNDFSIYKSISLEIYKKENLLVIKILLFNEKDFNGYFFFIKTCKTSSLYDIIILS